MKKSTKIVATIGPATETEAGIEKLIRSGMNVARFNTKHSTPEWHLERMKRIRTVAEKLGEPIGILLDLQGPEIRINIPGETAFEAKEGIEVIFTSQIDSKDTKRPIIPQIVVNALEVGGRIMVDDGVGEFIITKNTGTEIHARALTTFMVGHRKTLNTPGVTVDMPSLIPQDYAFLDAIDNESVDFVALSFVRTADDVHILRRELEERGVDAQICSKIENQSALNNLEKIIEVSDAVMVARGDLAVEVPFPELAYWQKRIIHLSREYGKPVITATQMLKSMVTLPRPTRAEVSDVANAVYDGTDAVMLSEETTIGKYPDVAVATQRAIVSFNEPHATPLPLKTADSSAASYVAHAAVSLLEISQLETNNIKIDKIVCLTESGLTPRLVSRFRPHVPIYAVTSSERTRRRLSMVFDVTPFAIKLPEKGRVEAGDALLEKLEEFGIAKSGETILLLHGTYWKKPGLTNTLSILLIP
ncbi:MAG: pyruvate kinase [Microgenomates group bacterium]